MSEHERDTDGVEHSKGVPAVLIVEVTAQPEERTTEDTIARVNRWLEGETVADVVTFEDMETVFSLLSPERLNLLETLIAGPPRDVRQLASELGCSVPDVSEDLGVFAEHGMIKLRTVGGVERPRVPYDMVHIDIDTEGGGDYAG